MFVRGFSTILFYGFYYFLCATCSLVFPSLVAADVYEVSKTTLLRSPLRAQRLPRSVDATAATYYNTTSELNRDAVESFWHKQLIKALPIKALNAKHRHAKTIQLPFEFPFYGAKVHKVTIATGGFIYAGDHEHSALLAASQYIAPLMANFETTTANDSNILIAQNATALSVLWQNVQLAHSHASGKFSFSATLHKSGDIVYTYLHVPIPASELDERAHPVQLGLSDAYIIHEMQRSTLYEYSRLTLPAVEAANTRIVYIRALPNCLMHTDCTTCIQHNGNENMQCVWCAKIKLCSTGLSRQRQQWLHAGCDELQTNDVLSCASMPSTPVESLESAESTLAQPDFTDVNNNFARTKSAPTRSCTFNTGCSSMSELKYDDNEDSQEQTTVPAQTTATLATMPIAESSTKPIVRHHRYYNSRIDVNATLASELWQRFLKLPIDEKLSGKFTTVKQFVLSFDFPFYGEIVRDVLVSMRGFISTSVDKEPFMNCIAPLSGNFDTIVSTDPSVRVQDNGTAFTVLWHNMQFRHRPDLGHFSFSATLHDNGNIVFVYYALPIPLAALGSMEHPIYVGLYDIFIMNEHIVDENDVTQTFPLPLIIGDVRWPHEEVSNSTFVYMKSMPACQQFNDCATCVVHKVGDLPCSWCPALQLCSTGVDRRTQKWQENDCHHNKVKDVPHCPAY